MLRNHYGSAIVGLLAVGLFVAPAAAEEDPRGGSGSSKAADNIGSPQVSASSETAGVWTEERMAAAVEAGPSEPTYGPTTLPEPGPKGSADGVLPTEPRPLDIHSMSGRVFFVDDRGEDHSCSGSTVNSGNKRLVFTAGHCVHGGAGRDWFDVDEWIFVPNFHSGSPHGQWHAYQLWTKTGWIDGDRAYDVAAVLMQPKDGVQIVDAVGGQGIRWGYGYGLDIYMFGYPADPPFDGSGLYYCSGTTWDESGFPTLGCNMTGGASGGPWLHEYNGESWSYLNGVNSWMFWVDDPTQVYKWQSPYFSHDTAGSLFEEVGDL